MTFSLFKKFIFLLLMVVLLFPACSKDSTDPQNMAPALPPQSTFIIDFNSFPLKDGAALPKPSGLSLQTKQNWTWAAANVAVWNTVLFVNLAVPVAAFQEALRHEPVRGEDGSWIWRYSFTTATVSYQAELHGSFDNNLANWKMYITKQDEFSQFLWYEGQGDLGYSHGTWTVYHSPLNAQPYLDIEWNRNPADNTADIKYTNVLPENVSNGSYIQYGTMNGDSYNAFYTIYHHNIENYTNIEWHRENREGRVQDVLHFGDESWHCWNDLLEDIECGS